MQLLSAKFTQIDATIDAKNTQIIALQTEVTELQEHRQQLLSVDQACTSALAQFDTAIAMLTHVDVSEIATFKNALLAKFDNDVIGILESAPEPEPAQQPDPTAPAPDAPVGDTPEPESEPVIDVQVSAKVEPTPAAQPEPAPDMDVEKELAKMPLVSLRMLAKSKGTDARGTKANITARLKALVTPTDIWALG